MQLDGERERCREPLAQDRIDGALAGVLELGERLADAYGRAFEPQYEPPRAGEVERVAISPKRAERELGWAPRTPLAKGLRLTAQWFRETAGRTMRGA